jgi:hypothetical protein
MVGAARREQRVATPSGWAAILPSRPRLELGLRAQAGGGAWLDDDRAPVVPALPVRLVVGRREEPDRDAARGLVRLEASALDVGGSRRLVSSAGAAAIPWIWIVTKS